MQSEIDTLDKKLSQLLLLTQRLRAENLQLRQDVASALNVQRKSQDKIEQAAQQLEKLLVQFPADAQ
jgi:cell division protein ZapB